MSKFGYKALAIAVASIGAMSANAAGLDRSGQDVTAFLQDGTYAEAVYTYMDTDISGYDNGAPGGASPESAYVKGKATGNITEKYDFFRYGVKTDINDRFSVGVLYDEPFGATVQHTDGLNTNFVSPSNLNEAQVYAATLNRLIATRVPADKQALARAALGDKKGAERVRDHLNKQSQLDEANARLLDLAEAAIGTTDALIANQGQGTNVEIRTQSLTGLVGAKFGDKRNFQVYGGPALERLTGEVHLRGAAYQGASGYDARISTDYAVGWAAGVAYSKPEIALKAALTYRSEIEHESTIAEVFPALGTKGVTSKDFKVTLPESYNLDFQTGVSPTMLLTAKVRYVPWSDFDIRPPTYGNATKIATGTALPIVNYDKDQWSAELGLGKKLSDKLAISGNIGYDSGAGSPVSSLGPVKGYYSVGGGFKYNITPNWSASLGAKYLKFGDTKAKLPDGRIVGNFEDNDGFVAGLKIAYQAK